MYFPISRSTKCCKLFGFLRHFDRFSQHFQRNKGKNRNSQFRDIFAKFCSWRKLDHFPPSPPHPLKCNALYCKCQHEWLDERFIDWGDILYKYHMSHLTFQQFLLMFYMQILKKNCIQFYTLLVEILKYLTEKRCAGDLKSIQSYVNQCQGEDNYTIES